MKLEIKSKTINGQTYEVTPFGAYEALYIQAELVKLIGPALGELIGGAGKLETVSKLLDQQIDGSAISRGIEAALKGITPEKFMELAERLLKQTTAKVQGPKGMLTFMLGAGFETALDQAFRGRLLDIYAVILFVLEVNYPDFFDRIAGIGDRLKTLMSASGTENTEPA